MHTGRHPHTLGHTGVSSILEGEREKFLEKNSPYTYLKPGIKRDCVLLYVKNSVVYKVSSLFLSLSLCQCW